MVELTQKVNGLVVGSIDSGFKATYGINCGVMRGGCKYPDTFSRIDAIYIPHIPQGFILPADQNLSQAEQLEPIYIGVLRQMWEHALNYFSSPRDDATTVKLEKLVGPNGEVPFDPDMYHIQAGLYEKLLFHGKDLTVVTHDIALRHYARIANSE
jgi:hypothetical protein